MNGTNSRNAIFPWGERAEASFDSSHIRPITELCLEGSVLRPAIDDPPVDPVGQEHGADLSRFVSCTLNRYNLMTSACISALARTEISLEDCMQKEIFHLKSTPSDSIFFTAKPFSSGLSKVPFKAYIFLCTVSFAMSAIILSQSVALPLVGYEGQSFNCSRPRFWKRMHAEEIALEVDSFGIAWGDGPRLYEKSTRLRGFSEASNSFSVEIYQQAMKFNGIYFILQQPFHGEGHVWAEFNLRYSKDNITFIEQHWRGWTDIIDSMNTILLFRWGPATTVNMDYFLWVSCYITVTIIFLTCIMFILIEKEQYVKPLVLTGIAILMIITIWDVPVRRSVWHMNDNNAVDVASLALQALMGVLLFFLMVAIWTEKFILLSIMLYGICNLASVVIAYNLERTFNIFTLLGYGILPCGFVIYNKIRMRVLTSSAHRLMKEDMAKYDEVFRSVISETDSSDLTALEDLSMQIFHESNACKQTRQLLNIKNLREMGKQLKLPQRNTVDGRLKSLISQQLLRLGGAEDFVALTNLDFLYTQACMLYPLVREVVTGWAKASGGILSHGVHDSGEEVEERVPNSGEHLLSQRLKSPSRAIEKVIRCYGGDASFLLDICRESIIFRDMASLVKCLQAIHADRNVHICRIKNRHSKAYNAYETGGYRDVAVNLQLKTGDAELLGVEYHTFELLLIHKSYYAIKDKDGHDRYVRWRNMRGR
uniref:Uncharacterized protein n=1 Tax=Hanusia phi TaxID=3032 RepID=A0A7S0HRF9_9CRYP|mmetsp:Transcript_30013/g.67908  ORF Transcript_30013/g.67908 Transcript_30013/m.67908 type:complete len:709 (+) Transcript_30013:212-2338(+)